MRNDAEQTVTELGRQLGLTPLARLRAGVVHERAPEPISEEESPAYKALWDYRRRLIESDP